MIADLDRTISELLAHALPPDVTSQVAISFAAPDGEFPPPSVSLPAINLFLYDLRENEQLREADWTVERGVNGATRRPPSVRVDCSYLITAWASSGSTTGPQDEHRLLGEVIGVLIRYPTLPEAVLQGALRDQACPLPTSALTPGRLQSLGEFWQALGGKPKAAVSLTVTIAMERGEPADLGPLVLDKRLGLSHRARGGS
jgi:hypothetical protein